MRVLLLYPPYPHLGGEELYGITQEELWFPLGIFAIGNAVLFEKAAEVKIYYQPDYTPATLEKVIRDFSPDLVGITCFTINRFACFELAQIIKNIDPKIKTIMGGTHATYMDRQVMGHYPCVDMLIRGYAEGAFLDIIRTLRDHGDLGKITGLTWRDKKNNIIKNCDRSLEDDLFRELAPEVKDLFIGELPRWRSEQLIQSSMPIETTRGCVYTCTFCSRMSADDRTVIERSPEQSLRYVKGLFDVFGKQQVFFCDTNFTLKKKRVKEFCDLIRKEEGDLEWICCTRVDLVNKEMLLELKEAGCRKIYYGVDSLCKKILPTVGRLFDPDVAVRNLNLTVECGLEAEANIIIGFPGENADTTIETYRRLRQVEPKVRLIVRPLLIMPGGPLYYQAVKEGFNEDFWLTDHEHVFPQYTGAMTAKQIREYCHILRTPSKHAHNKALAH